MLRRALVLAMLAVVLVTFVNPTTAAAQNKIIDAVKNAGKGFWGLMVRTPEAVLVDVSSAAANLFSGAAVVLSDIFAIGDRTAGEFVFDRIFSDGLSEIACFTHEGATSAVELGTRRDFADVPINREEFVQRREIFHKKAYRTFPYAMKSLGLAVLDLTTGIPANVCTMFGLTDASEKITKAADSAAETMFGKIQWKYEHE
jgi:hypothetical protein